MLKRNDPRFSVLFLALIAPAASEADEDPFGRSTFQSERVADNVVSIATGHAQSSQKAPASTSVITAQQIESMGAQDLFDILRTVPGFYLNQNTYQLNPIISVRGFRSTSNQNVLILLDGIPQTEYISGDRVSALGKIPLDIIERIEIMRGPGSALHGADAYSAVVDIITWKTPADKSRVTLRGGSYKTGNARLLSGGRTGNFDVVGAFEYQETDGHAPYISADSQTLLDAIFHTDASFAPGNANTHFRTLGAQLNATSDNFSFRLRTSLSRDIGPMVGLANALDPFGDADMTIVESNVAWKTRGSHWSANVALNQYFYESAINNMHIFPPGASRLFPDGIITSSSSQQHNTRLQGSWNYTGLRSHRISVGTGVESGKTHQKSEKRNFSITGGRLTPLGSLTAITDPASMAFGARDFSHDLQFLYLQDEWTIHPNWVLTWGARYDHYSDYGDQINPRIVLVWDSSPYLTTKFIYGEGFRGPAQVDTMTRQSPVLTGNPDLKPERVKSFELAFDYRFRPDLLARLNLFYQKTQDKIQILAAPGPKYLPVNTAPQVGRGAELEAWWTIDPRTQWYASYSYQDSVNEATDTDVGYHPHHLVYTRLQRQRGPWLFSLQGRYVGQRDRFVGDTRSHPDTFVFVDALVRYHIAPDFVVGFDVRNLFDREAQDAGPVVSGIFPGDIPLPGRNFYFTFQGRF